MNKEYIAYEGKALSIEWYYDKCGRSQALEYYTALSQAERISVLRLFKRMGDAGELKDTTKFNYEGKHIYAFKPKPERFLCFFFSGKKLVVTNAFRKKQQKLPENEKDRALKAKEDYIFRVKKGAHYD